MGLSPFIVALHFNLNFIRQAEWHQTVIGQGTLENKSSQNWLISLKKLNVAAATIYIALSNGRLRAQAGKYIKGRRLLKLQASLKN